MGFKVPKDTPPMERELMYLMADLCVKWGFCIPPEDLERISKAKCYTAQAFARDLLLAEGMNPDHESGWRNRIAARFREWFGADDIDSASFVDKSRRQ